MGAEGRIASDMVLVAIENEDCTSSNGNDFDIKASVIPTVGERQASLGA